MEHEHEIESTGPDAVEPFGATPVVEPEPLIPAPARKPAPAFADGADRPLESGWIAVARFGSLVAWSILGVVAFVALGIVALAVEIPFPLFVVLTFSLLALVGGILALATFWPKWEHARAGYRLLPDRIECWHGLVWRRSISVPISRVQYTDVKQGPMQRKYAIATLVVHTAGTLGSDIEFPGLPPALANEVRDWLVGETGSDAV